MTVLTSRRSSALLLVLSATMILDAVEVSVVLVAVPHVAADLGLSLVSAQWLVSGFAAGFAVLLPFGPWLARRFGRRRTYLTAMAGFAVASLAGGVADSGAVLIGIRAVKGMCAALTAPAGLAIIATTYPDEAARRRAVAVYSLFGAAGFTTGLLLSGVLAESGWRWTFVFPAPVAIALMLLSRRLLPPDSPESAHSDVRPTGLRITGALLGAAVTASALNGGYQTLLLLLTFDLQGRFGWTGWQSAFALLPACLPLALAAPWGAALVARFGGDRLIALGAAAALLGYLSLLWHPHPARYVTGVLPALSLVGLGLVLSFAALNMRATTAAPPGRGPAAIAFYQAAVQAGTVALLPVAATVTAAGERRTAWLILSLAAAVGLLAAVGVSSPHRKAVP
ncbi:MFS transporter [Micromonospora sp. NPDC049101]|uniref:MFS transporter n=1 Tax=Micromonospora sp. NPDC049101 TaxID=3155032 RepID=UPI0033F35458